jgi:hypothetical protein
MLNKVTKLPKSRFYVFGFCEKKQFVGRNATPNMGWLVEIKKKDQNHKK